MGRFPIISSMTHSTMTLALIEELSSGAVHLTYGANLELKQEQSKSGGAVETTKTNDTVDSALVFEEADLCESVLCLPGFQCNPNNGMCVPIIVLPPPTCQPGQQTCGGDNTNFCAFGTTCSNPISGGCCI